MEIWRSPRTTVEEENTTDASLGSLCAPGKLSAGGNKWPWPLAMCVHQPVW